MSDMPERIAVWRFHPEKADEWVHGGWSDDHDRKTTEYIRADTATTWQPIETAPKDGAHVLLGNSFESDISVGFWHDEEGVWAGLIDGSSVRNDWGNFHEVCPTHWMPLPQPPEGEE